MNSLRKFGRKLRPLLWGALFFALFSYVVKPLRNGAWKSTTPEEVCRSLQAGRPARDLYGNSFSYDPAGRTARSAGPDQQPGTADDLVYRCD